MKKTATLLWIDLEMTGLVASEDKILEVAAIATDWDLKTVAEMTATVQVDKQILRTRMVGKFWDSHAKVRANLISQNANGEPIEKVERKLLDFIAQNFRDSAIDSPKYADKIILAGNSIHQDRKFLEAEMPRLARKLHYRMLDVSAWKVWFEGALKQSFSKPEAHRALEDIKGSIEELKFYVSKIERKDKKSSAGKTVDEKSNSF